MQERREEEHRAALAAQAKAREARRKANVKARRLEKDKAKRMKKLQAQQLAAQQELWRQAMAGDKERLENLQKRMATGLTDMSVVLM